MLLVLIAGLEGLANILVARINASRMTGYALQCYHHDSHASPAWFCHFLIHS